MRVNPDTRSRWCPNLGALRLPLQMFSCPHWAPRGFRGTQPWKPRKTSGLAMRPTAQPWDINSRRATDWEATQKCTDEKKKREKKKVSKNHFSWYNHRTCKPTNVRFSHFKRFLGGHPQILLMRTRCLCPTVCFWRRHGRWVWSLLRITWLHQDFPFLPWWYNQLWPGSRVLASCPRVILSSDLIMRSRRNLQAQQRLAIPEFSTC